GEAPNPVAPPSGCRFHERCPFQMEICRTVEPTSTPTAGGSVRCHLHGRGPLPWRFVDGEVVSEASVSVAETDGTGGPRGLAERSIR
ncbi:MAG TPA: oligopeptide/dipeptide ABC transporter ATP-binding protein, partial [Ilumatobacter sp.]|nr:oligopeptide/dipeptide ABC transporter ATP-binding protein [Ilumatobacter sp.]